MLAIVRDNSDVIVKLDLHVPTYETRVFGFTFKCGNEVYAGLLTQAMREAVSDALMAARKQAYDQGWADAKAKRAKQTWFRRTI